MPFLNHKQKPIFYPPQGHEVDVIVSYKANGDLIPLYFRIEIEDAQRYEFKIQAVHSIKDKHGIKQFECEYQAYEQYHRITLVLDIDHHVWVVG